MTPARPATGADLMASSWVPIPGDALRSANPARPADILWQGSPRTEHAALAVAAARSAAPVWSSWPIERRAAALQRVAAHAATNAPELAALIRDEVGKPLWDARAEADLIAAKIARRRVRGFSLDLAPARRGECWFRPHGVAAVIGPFNFPAHLPNGHIVPALLMGNTVVFKPSDKAPAVGELLARWFDEALRAEGAPPGVLNLVQGGADVASALTSHPDLDAVFFTGSWPVGRRIMEASLDRPGRLLALEMGGNNAAIILPDADLAQAVIECVRSAYITAGQRCTCTRRLIVHRAVADKVIPAIVRAARELRVGDPSSDPPVFMGPLISHQAADAVLSAQRELIGQGGRALAESTPLVLPGGGSYITPGVLQVDRFTSDPQFGAGRDQEIFGPFLRIAIADSFEEALAQADATAFGLAASLFTHDPAAIATFRTTARAGCININTGTAGASGKLPFGGLGLSGNHRPAGSFSLDYCAYPVAGMIEQGAAATQSPGMSFDPAWLA